MSKELKQLRAEYNALHKKVAQIQARIEALEDRLRALNDLQDRNMADMKRYEEEIARIKKEK